MATTKKKKQQQKTNLSPKEAAAILVTKRGSFWITDLSEEDIKDACRVQRLSQSKVERVKQQIEKFYDPLYKRLKRYVDNRGL